MEGTKPRVFLCRPSLPSTPYLPLSQQVSHPQFFICFVQGFLYMLLECVATGMLIAYCRALGIRIPLM